MSQRVRQVAAGAERVGLGICAEDVMDQYGTRWRPKVGRSEMKAERGLTAHRQLETCRAVRTRERPIGMGNQIGMGFGSKACGGGAPADGGTVCG